MTHEEYYCVGCNAKFAGYVLGQRYQYCESCNGVSVKQPDQTIYGSYENRTQVIITSLRTRIDALDRSNGTLQNALDTSDLLLEQARVALVDAEIKAAHQRERAEQAERELAASRQLLRSESSQWASMARDLMAAVEQLHQERIVPLTKPYWKWELESDARLALGVSRSSPWQPIETAPRDGTSVQIRHWDILPVNAFWKDGKWVPLEYQYPSHANPTHWAPIAPREQP